MVRVVRMLPAPQPAVGIVTGTMAVLTLQVAWTTSGAMEGGIGPVVVAFILAAAVIVAYQHPIHLRTHTKVCMSEIPYYLLAALASPALAASAAGVGALCAEISVRAHRGSRPSDIAAECGRRVLLVFVGGVVAHLGTQGLTQAIALVGAALILGIGDIATFPLVLARLRDPHPWRAIPMVAGEASWTEGIQYVLGLLGAYAAMHALWTLALLTVPTYLIYYSAKNAKELHDDTRRFLEDLADTVDLRDPYTGGHSRRVTAFCAGILRVLECTGPEETLIIAAARVHDIGKIGVPDGVLNKPGPLTPEERVLMETHPVLGADFLKRYRDFVHGVDIVRSHHERWDGQGYPDGLAGLAIPFGARVIAVADSFDAMTSDRPYRRGMPVEAAVRILREGKERQWDARIVDAFLQTIAEQSTMTAHFQPAAPEDMKHSTVAGAA